MSEAGPGPGWWKASDGQWYPPEQRPGDAPGGTPGATSGSPPGQPPGVDEQPRSSGVRTGAIVVWATIGVVVVVGLLVWIVALRGDDTADGPVGTSSTSTSSTTTEPPGDAVPLATWERGVDQVCADFDEASDVVLEDFAGELEALTIDEGVDLYEQLATLNDALLEDLEAVGLPEGEESTVEEFLDLLAEQSGFLREVSDLIDERGTALSAQTLGELDGDTAFEDAYEDIDERASEVEDRIDELALTFDVALCRVNF